MNKKIKKLGVYIHIPFCLRKCNYCDFLSFPASESVQESYINALCNEIRRFCRGKSFEADSIFIGGGTPSVLSQDLVEKLMKTVGECFGLKQKDDVGEKGGSSGLEPEYKSDIEITVEVNPGTMTAEKAEIYRKCGINRVSMGVQSTKDCILERIGRIHRSAEFYETFSTLRDAGFDNINTDIMFALPGQSISDWQETVNSIINLKPEHISFYSLIIEEGTPFYEDLRNGKIVQSDDVTDRKMYRYAVETLKKASYNHYEISNAALQGRESKHNLKYWNMEEYVGFGLGAHSFIDRKRFCNISDLDRYLDLYSKFEEKTEGEREIFSTYEIINANSKKDDMEEFIFTGLRKIEGISKSYFGEYTGADIYEVYSSQIKKMTEENMLEDSGDRLKLTDKGLDFANYVMREFLLD